MHRFFVPAAVLEGQTADLPPETARQVTRVLRLRAGERIVLFTGDGAETEAVLTEAGPTGVTVQLGERRTPEVELPCRLHVAVAVLKGEKLDWVVQKLTELGVSRISFLTTRRSVVEAGAERWERRLTRYRRISVEAVEQCGRVRVPEIGEPLELRRLLGEPGRKLCLAPRSGRLLTESLHPCPEDLTVIVGPEGGFTDEELQVALEAGAEAVGLGRRVLRAETAAVAAAALVAAAAEG